MELWVRSQDKKRLCQVYNLSILEKYNSNDKVEWIIEGNIDKIGKYATKKRAIEVLDEIQRKINLINLGHDFGSPMIDLDNPTYVYEMPEE